LTALTYRPQKSPFNFELNWEAIDKSAGFPGSRDRASAKVMRIRDTLSLETVEISEAFLKNSEGAVESGTAFGCGRD